MIKSAVFVHKRWMAILSGELVKGGEFKVKLKKLLGESAHSFKVLTSGVC
jgi:hypothetical protein